MLSKMVTGSSNKELAATDKKLAADRTKLTEDNAKLRAEVQMLLASQANANKDSTSRLKQEELRLAEQKAKHLEDLMSTLLEVVWAWCCWLNMCGRASGSLICILLASATLPAAQTHSPTPSKHSGLPS